MHQRTQMLEQKEVALADKIAAATAACEACMAKLGPGKGFSTKGLDAEKVKKEFKQVLDVLSAPVSVEAPMYQRIPPSLVSNLADQKGVTDDFLDAALLRGRVSTKQDSSMSIPEDVVDEEGCGQVLSEGQNNDGYPTKQVVKES